MSRPSGKIHQFERKALCHTCYSSNVTCTAHPGTALPECASCRDKRENPPKSRSQETSPE